MEREQPWLCISLGETTSALRTLLPQPGLILELPVPTAPSPDARPSAEELMRSDLAAG
jgi:hypothetical protein